MERLIDHALIYGSMATINQPHLIERYNNALKAFGLPSTKLETFKVDAMGFSPEVAEELGNNEYLDPNGVNRRFIIVTPEQAGLPAVNIQFSSTTDLMREFYEANSEAIHNLTLRDAVYGEIKDAAFRVDSLDDILAIKRVKFSVHTPNKLMEKAARLISLADRFEAADNSWQDDELMHEIVGLAAECGDPRSIEIVPTQLQFDSQSFWTSHLGGFYVFHEQAEKALVIGDLERLNKKKVKRPWDKLFDIKNHQAVLDFLTQTDRIEPVNMDWLQSSGIADIRFGIFCRTMMAEETASLYPADISDLEMDNWVHANITRLKKSKQFRQLYELHKIVINGGHPDFETFDDEMTLMSVRANPDHPDQLLVNRFLSEYVGYDFLTRFIVNKQAFYRDYERFDDAMKDYAVRLISAVYFPAKDELWHDFFENWRLEDA